MKFAGQVEQIKSNSMRLVGHSGGLDDPGIKGNSPHQGEFGRV